MPYKLDIRTAQNVIIEYEVANVWDRIVAYLVDALIITAYAFFVSLIFGSITNSITNAESYTWVLILFFIPVMFYSLLFEILNNGQSPGKLAVNIQVVSISGESVTVGQYFLRWLFRIVDLYIISFIVAVLVIAIGEKGQRVGDLVAGTAVITRKKRQTLNKTVFEKVKESYKPVFPEAVQLSTKDVQTIKEVLANRAEHRFEMITKLAKKVEEKLEISKNGSSETFLKIIVKDFNYYQSLE